MKEKARLSMSWRTGLSLVAVMPAATMPDTPSPSVAKNSSFSWFLAGCCGKDCRAVIGNGVVLDPLAFMKEVGCVPRSGVEVAGNLFVSNRAHVILPYHRMIELAAENAPGRIKIGTTWRGIGPSL